VETGGVQVRAVLLRRVLARHVPVWPHGGGHSVERNEAAAAAGEQRAAAAPGRSRSAESCRGGFRDRSGKPKRGEGETER